MGLNNTDLIKIQDSCPFLRKIKEEVLNLKTEKFKIYEKILYKTEKVLSSEINKLALPVHFAEQVLYNSHYTMARHMSAQSHVKISQRISTSKTVWSWLKGLLENVSHANLTLQITIRRQVGCHVQNH